MVRDGICGLRLPEIESCIKKFDFSLYKRIFFKTEDCGTGNED